MFIEWTSFFAPNQRFYNHSYCESMTLFLHRIFTTSWGGWWENLTGFRRKCTTSKWTRKTIWSSTEFRTRSTRRRRSWCRRSRTWCGTTWRSDATSWSRPPPGCTPARRSSTAGPHSSLSRKYFTFSLSSPYSWYSFLKTFWITCNCNVKVWDPGVPRSRGDP